ncbi:MAG: carboxymuconolactone decarboxylase family protein [Acidobacteriota bacterium]|nr:carboxymuconolactone decarboxylase family protein [Acidobacteriota bacterium]
MATTVKAVEPARNEALAEIEKKTGPSNFFRTMAHRPEAMQDFARLYADLMGPGARLDRRLREMVYLAVSDVNECAYCAEHHRKTAQAAGISDQEMGEINTENNQHFSLKEQTALHYARELTRNSMVSDDLRYRAQEQFSTDEFVELTMVVCLANFTNRFNNGLAVPSE